MKIYCGGRANGKTMKAIQLSVEKQMPIICWSYEHKKQIKQTAKKNECKMDNTRTNIGNGSKKKSNR